MIDIPIDIGIEAPSEDIPIVEDDNNEGDWISDSEGEDDVFIHSLVQSDANPSYGKRTRREYKNRLEAERRAWESQEEALTTAYMEWKVNQSVLEGEAEGMDWFSCQVISLFSE
jgi:hypothetical protein